MDFEVLGLRAATRGLASLLFTSLFLAVGQFEAVGLTGPISYGLGTESGR